VGKQSTAEKVRKLFKDHEESESPAKEVRKVAKKKAVEIEEEDEAPVKKGKGPKKVTKVSDKKEAKSNGKAEKSEKSNRGPQEVPEGHVSVAMLAEEAEITAQSARVKLRSSDIERPEGRWVWPEGSKALKKAREILGL
jgi:hypothetical protein